MQIRHYPVFPLYREKKGVALIWSTSQHYLLNLTSLLSTKAALGSSNTRSMSCHRAFALSVASAELVLVSKAPTVPRPLSLCHSFTALTTPEYVSGVLFNFFHLLKRELQGVGPLVCPFRHPCPCT